MSISPNSTPPDADARRPGRERSRSALWHQAGSLSRGSRYRIGVWLGLVWFLATAFVSVPFQLLFELASYLGAGSLAIGIATLLLAVLLTIALGPFVFFWLVRDFAEFYGGEVKKAHARESLHNPGKTWEAATGSVPDGAPDTV